MLTTIFIGQSACGEFTVRLQSDDSVSFATCIESLKDCIPASMRKYKPRERTWYISQPARDALHRWTHFCHRTAQADIEWPEEGDARNHAPSASHTPAEAYATLHLLPSAPPEVIKAAYRALAHLHHPDHGGDTQEMQAVNAAYQQLVKTL